MASDKEKEKKGMSRGMKALITVITVILCIVIILVIFLSVWFFADSYDDLKYFKEEFAIPGLGDGTVPQGLGSYTDENGNAVYFMCCYMNDGSASRIYVIDEDDETEKYVVLKNGDGSDFTGHCGGIASDGTRVWLSSETYVYTFGYDALTGTAAEGGADMTVPEGTTIDYVNDDGAIFDIAYLFYDAENCALYAGEFYREQNYPTASSHKVTTPAGDENTAVAYRMSCGDEYETGFNPVPDFAVSTTEKIQGFAISGGRVCLSESYGLSDSHIYIYDYEAALTDQIGTMEIYTAKNTSVEIPLYCLDSSDLVETLTLPSMTEGLCVNGDRVYVLFESAGKKYRLYVREREYNVLSFSPADV